MLERIYLRIVQQVEKQASLTVAAGVLHLTQSALSHSMKKLEQQLDTGIWLRQGRSLRPTRAGQYLLAVASRVLPQLDLAEEHLGRFAQGERGALRIGMECHPLLAMATQGGLALTHGLAGREGGRETEVLLHLG
ncbi:LysR family transcriptional regulator [Chitinibacteraceae bacterium HSL-7]